MDYELLLSSEAERFVEEQLLWVEADEIGGGAGLADRRSYLPLVGKIWGNASPGESILPRIRICGDTVADCSTARCTS